MTGLAAADVIRLLELMPHPEGGHFRETFRDQRSDGGRAASTAIYFLLAAGEVSHWHAGAPLELAIAAPRDAPNRIRLGNDLDAGERPQTVVPAGHWQSAKSLGAWTLVGCTVAPGFEFAGFDLAPPGFEPGAASE